MHALNEAEYAYLLQNDLGSFIGRVFEEVSPWAAYQHNWHVDLIASKLEECRRGEIKRLIINLPPRNMKSICASVAFPAWLLANNPNCQIICASYGQDLANKHARDCRAVMESSWYRALFRARLNPKKSAVEEFATTRGGMRMATSVGGVLTGRGADVIILDDPLKPEEAFSDSPRQAVNRWYDGTLYSRLNDKTKGCIILIMQRLHEADLVGHVLAQEGWEQLVLPAIAEAPEEHRYQTLLGQHCVRRSAGDALHPARESLAMLAQLRASMGEYHFAGQYQQAPVPLGGGIVKRAWLRCYSEPLPKFEGIYQSWDTANKASDTADYSVCTTWGVWEKQYYLLDVLRARLEFPDLKRAVMAQQQRWKAKAVLIEDRASGTQLLQEIRGMLPVAVVAISSASNKYSRLMGCTSRIEAGDVLLPEQAPWRDAFVQELTAFPYSKFDDQVDSLSQFLQWHRGRSTTGAGYRIRRL